MGAIEGGCILKSYHKKVLFLELVFLYVLLILGVKKHVADHPDCVMTFLKVAETSENQTSDPYEELPKKVALTFDDGPYPGYTEKLLDGLKERKVKATFFVLGIQAEKYPEILERISEEGHLIGNHTYSHILLKKNNRKEFKEDLKKAEELISEVTGEGVLYVRPPYGKWDKNLEQELNMFRVLWTVDPKDWCKDDASGIARTVLKNVKENDIILLHDRYKASVEAALIIVDELTKQGYEFVTVDEILLD